MKKTPMIESIRAISDRISSGVYLTSDNEIIIESYPILVNCLTILQSLIDNLPKCTIGQCKNIATRASGRGGNRHCDDHKIGPSGHIVPEYPRANDIRKAVLLIDKLGSH